MEHAGQPPRLGRGEHVGKASYEWLSGGFFLRQQIDLDFAGMLEVRSEEMIGCDSQTGELRSLVFSNMSPVPLPYEWEVGDDHRMTIRVSYGPMDATFEGGLNEDGKTFSGGWRPNPGTDESVNIPYDIRGRADLLEARDARAAPPADGQLRQ